MSILSKDTCALADLKRLLTERLTAMVEIDQKTRPFVIVSEPHQRFVQFASQTKDDGSVVVLFDIPNQGFYEAIIAALEGMGFTREPLDADVKWTWQKKDMRVADAVLDAQAIFVGLVGLLDTDTVAVEFGTTDLPPPATN